MRLRLFGGLNLLVFAGAVVISQSVSTTSTTIHDRFLLRSQPIHSGQYEIAGTSDGCGAQDPHVVEPNSACRGEQSRSRSS